MKMKKKILMWLAALMAGVATQAQTIIDSWGFSTGVDSTLWVDLGVKDSMLIEPGMKISGVSGVVDIGFPVEFAGTTYTQFSVNINGTVHLGDRSLASSGYYSQPLGRDAVNYPKVEPFGARGCFDTLCYTRMARTTIGGEQAVVVETRLQDYTSLNHVSFQVHLLAAGVRIVYGPSDGGFDPSTQNGWVAASGSNCDVVFVDFATHSAVRWDSGNNPVQRNMVWPAEWRWYMLSPDSILCPYPPSVNTTGNNPASLTLSRGDVADLRVRIPAAGIDTLWLSSSNYLTINNRFNPFTTYSGTVQRVCDSTHASLRTRNFSFSTVCGPSVAHLPWSCGFDNQQQGACWETSHYDAVMLGPRWGYSSSAMRCGQTYAVNYDTWLVSPELNLPDGDGITLEFSYKSEALSGTVPTVEVRVAVVDTIAGLPSESQWTTLAVLNEVVGSYTTYRFSLDAVRGHRVKVCFARTGNGGRYVYVDNFMVRQYLEPEIELLLFDNAMQPLATSPCYAHVGDTLAAVCHLLTGVAIGESHAWTSSMRGAFAADDTLRWVYTEDGVDTLTVVHTNIYGSDTATLVVNVADCRPVLAYPWREHFERGIDCWQQEGEGTGWQHNATGGVDGTAAAVRATGQVATKQLVSQPMVIPSDAYMLRMSWQMKRGSAAWRRVALLAYDAYEATATQVADTLLVVEGSQLTTAYSRFEAALDSLSGRTVRLAFDVVGQTSSAILYLDDIEVRYMREPVLAVESPHHASQGGTARFAAHLSEGDTVGLVYSWHSSLTGQSLSDTSASSIFSVAYAADGVDTIVLVATNAYGSAFDTLLLQVCPVIDTFPWQTDLADESGIQCWDIVGYTYASRSSRVTNEDGGASSSHEGILKSNAVGAYILLPPMAIPADAHNLAISFSVVRTCFRVLVCSTGSTDTADYVEIASWPCLTVDATRKVLLEPYAGQTIRLALVSNTRSSVELYSVAVDYDTLPKLHDIVVPAKAVTDSLALCTALMRYGSTDSLRYEWHSAMASAGLASFVASGDTLRIRYSTGGVDTITLVALNAYGTDTLVRTFTVQDCTPALTLPWRDDFSEGFDCWYAPAGSNWRLYTPQYTNYIMLASDGTSDTVDSWIVSKPLLIPTDTALLPHLFWDASTNNGYFQHHYEVLVAPDSSYTDLSAYVPAFVHDTTLPLVQKRYSADLTPWAGQMVRVAFRNRPVHWTSGSIALYVDNVELRPTAAPRVALSGPSSVLNDAEALFEGTLLEGGADSLHFSFHSTLRDTSFSSRSSLQTLQWRFRYTGPGIDTVTFVATNRFGSDTARFFVNVNFVYQPEVTLYPQYPYSIYVGDTTYFYATYNNCYFDNHNFEWLSTMAAAGRAITEVRDSQLYVFYLAGASGNDTVRVVFNTNFGSDTDWVSFPVLSHPLPQVVSLTCPTVVQSPDSILVQAGVNGCSSNGLSVSWHSSLLGASWSSPVRPAGFAQWRLFYPVGTSGTDTVTVIAGNAYGADTVVSIVRVQHCTVMPVPYFEDFEGLEATAFDTAGFLPDCWHPLWTGSEALAPHVVDHYRNLDLPGNALFFGCGSAYTQPLATIATVILPRFDADIHELSLSLTYRAEGMTYGNLSVGYVDSIGLFVPLRTLDPHTEFFRDTVPFGDHSIPSDAVMAIRWRLSRSYNGVFGVVVDDVHVFRDSTLYPPENLAVGEVETFCATLQWDSVRMAEHYLVQIDGVADTVVDGPDATLCGLATNTHYTARVASLRNGATDTSRFAEVDFLTECRIVDLPAFFSFDSTSRLPACWGSSPSNAAVVISPNYNTEGVLYLGAASGSAFVFSPLVEAPADELLVSFWASSAEDSADFEAGVLTVPGDTTTFVPLYRGMAVRQPAFVQFGTMSAPGDHVAVAFRHAARGNYLIVDNLTIDPLPFCPRVYGVEVQSDDPRSAVVSWRAATYGVASLEQYELYLTDRADSTRLGPWTMQNDTVVHLDGLQPGHVYDGVIRSICIDDTAWTPPFVVAPAATFCAEEIYTPDDGNDETLRDSRVIPVSDFRFSYSQTLYSSLLAAPLDTLFGIAYHVLFSNGNGSDHLIDVYIGQTMADTFTAPIPASRLTLAAHDYVLSLRDTGWVTINFTTPVPLDVRGNLVVTIDDNTDSVNINQYVLFATHNKRMGGTLHYGDNYSNPHPDSLDFEATMMNRIVPDIRLLGPCSTLRCLPPVVEAEADTHSIRLSWDQRGVEPLWRVEYRQVGEMLWTVDDTVYDNDAHILSGLSAGCLYEVRVASMCEGGDTLWSLPRYVRTLCGPVSLPYYEDFRLDEEQPCWQLGRNTILSDGRGLWLLGSGEVPVVSPAFDAALDTLQMRLTARGGGFGVTAMLYVGVCEADGSDLQWIDTLVLSPDTQEFTLFFDRYSGSARHIALLPNMWGSTISDLAVEPVPPCRPVGNLVLKRLESTAATVAWNPVAGQSQWTVYLDSVAVGTTADTTYTLTGLAPQSSHTVSVAPACYDASLPQFNLFNPQFAVAFTTLCLPRPLPYVEDFSAYDDLSQPDCWHIALGGDNGLVRVFADSLNARLQLYDYLSSFDGDTATNFALTPMLLGDGHRAVIRFRVSVMRGEGEDVDVGLMDNPADMASFQSLVHFDSFQADSSFEFILDSLRGPVALAFRWRGYTSVMVSEIIVHHFYTVSVQSADSTMGTVAGGGEYEYSDVAPLVATPLPGYQFVAWSDGSRTAEYHVIVTSDTLLTAHFRAADPAAIDSPSASPDASLAVYPVPAGATLTVCLGEAFGTEVGVQFLDLHGRTVLDTRLKPQNSQPAALDVSSLPRGVYFLRATSEGRTALCKVILQ